MFTFYFVSQLGQSGWEHRNVTNETNNTQITTHANGGGQAMNGVCFILFFIIFHSLFSSSVSFRAKQHTIAMHMFTHVYNMP